MQSLQTYTYTYSQTQYARHTSTCISRNGLIIAHIVSKRNTLYQTENSSCWWNTALNPCPSFSVDDQIPHNIKLQSSCIREQTGINTILSDAAMTGSAAHELLAMYCAACMLHKYLPVESLEVDTICWTTTIHDDDCKNNNNNNNSYNTNTLVVILHTVQAGTACLPTLLWLASPSDVW
jgi:hypothetical protein